MLAIAILGHPDSIKCAALDPVNDDAKALEPVSVRPVAGAENVIDPEPDAAIDVALIELPGDCDGLALGVMPTSPA
jgi:hypothetical protein